LPRARQREEATGWRAMSAADDHYAQLLRDVAASKARREASAAAKASGETRYWYFINEDYCPPCGRTDVSRERIYGPRPDRWEDRHQFSEIYDWCLG